MKKFSLKAILMSLLILYTSAACLPSYFEKAVEASYPQEEMQTEEEEEDKSKKEQIQETFKKSVEFMEDAFNGVYSGYLEVGCSKHQALQQALECSFRAFEASFLTEENYKKLISQHRKNNNDINDDNNNDNNNNDNNNDNNDNNNNDNNDNNNDYKSNVYNSPIDSCLLA